MKQHILIVTNKDAQFKMYHYVGLKDNLSNKRRIRKTTVINPSNAKATFVRRTRMQRLLKTILTLSCWYSLDSSR